MIRKKATAWICKLVSDDIRVDAIIVLKERLLKSLKELIVQR